MRAETYLRARQLQDDIKAHDDAMLALRKMRELLGQTTERATLRVDAGNGLDTTFSVPVSDEWARDCLDSIYAEHVTRKKELELEFEGLEC